MMPLKHQTIVKNNQEIGALCVQATEAMNKCLIFTHEIRLCAGNWGTIYVYGISGDEPVCKYNGYQPQLMAYLQAFIDFAPWHKEVIDHEIELHSVNA